MRKNLFWYLSVPPIAATSTLVVGSLAVQMSYWNVVPYLGFLYCLCIFFSAWLGCYYSKDIYSKIFKTAVTEVNTKSQIAAFSFWVVGNFLLYFLGMLCVSLLPFTVGDGP